MKTFFSTKILFVILIFTLAILSRELFAYIPGYSEYVASLSETLRWLVQPLRWLLIIIVGLSLAGMASPRDWFDELGLSASILKPMLVAVAGVSPMLIGPMLMGVGFAEVQPMHWLFLAGIWPLAEELLYRGYAFGQLYRLSGMGFWPSAILTSVVFGLVHLAQSSVQGMAYSDQLATISLISLGGLLYAWLYVRWSMNLWMPFLAHGLMNLSWQMYDLSATPLGGIEANALRLASLILLVGLTLYFTEPSASSSEQYGR